MKIIDLLNKIANGEEVPRSVFYKGEDFVFNYNENTYVCCDHDLTPLFSEYNMKQENFLNDEVKISDEYNVIVNLQDTLKDREEYCYGLETHLENLQKIIDITKNNIDITMQIIREQPTINDEWILERLNGIREVMNK